MDYLCKDEYNQVYYVQKNQLILVENSLENFLDKLLNQRFSSLKANLSSLKKIFGFMQKTPIYINRQCLLFPLQGRRNKNVIYINYYAVVSFKKIHDGNIILTFQTKHEMLIQNSKVYIIQQNKCEKIINFLNAQDLP